MPVQGKMVWLLWLLLWHTAWGAPGATHQVGAGLATRRSAENAAVRVPASCADANKQSIQAACYQTDHGPFMGPDIGMDAASLHHFVYEGDADGLRSYLSKLSQQEHFPTLLGAIQANDDRGMTIAHMLACAGWHEELHQLMDVLFRMQGDGVEMIRRIVLESRNEDACQGKNCELLADRPGLYAHGTLQFFKPSKQVVLFGAVTPFECAAAHGHVQAMKLLIQGGVTAGKVFEVAKIFGHTQRLHDAIQLANVEGFFAQPQVFEPSSKPNAPQRQPRVRRSSKAKNPGSAATARTSSTKPQVAPTVKLRQTESADLTGTAGARSSMQDASFKPASVISASTEASLAATAEVDSRSKGADLVPNTASFTSAGNATSSSAGQETRLSEMLDIAALLLLTGMLLLPVWSTLCLLWRRAMRKRAAIAEPARRIKQAMATTATLVPIQTSSVACSSSSSSSAVLCTDTVAATAHSVTSGGVAAALSTLTLKRNAAGASSASSSLTGVRQRKVSQAEQQVLPRQPSTCGEQPVSNSVPASSIGPQVNGRLRDAGSAGLLNAVQATSSSSCTNTDVGPAFAATARGNAHQSTSGSFGVISSSTVTSTSISGKQKHSKHPATKVNLHGSAKDDSSLQLESTSISRSSSDSSTGLAAGLQPLIVDVHSLQQAVQAESRAVANAKLAAAAGSNCSSGNKSVMKQCDAAAVPPGCLQDAVPVNNQQQMPQVRSGGGKQKSKRSGKHGTSQKAAAAMEGVSNSSGLDVRGDLTHKSQTQLLSGISADDATQAAKACAALIAPYTPTAASGARPAIYQPPGSSSTDAAVKMKLIASMQSTDGAVLHKPELSLPGAGLSKSGKNAPSEVSNSGSADKTQQLGAPLVDSSHDTEPCRDQNQLAPVRTASCEATCLSISSAMSSAATDIDAHVDSAVATYGVPASTISMTSAASASSHTSEHAAAVGCEVKSCNSIPTAGPPLEIAIDSSSTTSRAPPTVQMQLSSSHSLQYCSSGSFSSGGSAAALSSSGSGSSTGSASNMGGLGGSAMIRKLSDAASVASEAGSCMLASIPGSSSHGAADASAGSQHAMLPVRSLDPADIVDSAAPSKLPAVPGAAAALPTILDETRIVLNPSNVRGEAICEGTSVDVEETVQRDGNVSRASAATVAPMPMTADAEVEYPPRSSTVRPSITGSPLVPGIAEQQQQQHVKVHELQQLVPVLGPDCVEALIPAGTAQQQQLQLTPELLSQMAHQWQHQPHSQKQQVPASTALSSPLQQSMRVVIQPMVAGGVPPQAAHQQQQSSPAPLQLPPGMVALLQASKGHGMQQQQSQQHAQQQHLQRQQQQQQKLMVLLPQQQGVPANSHSASLPAASPGQMLHPQQLHLMQQQQQLQLQRMQQQQLQHQQGAYILSPGSGSRDASMALAIATLQQQQGALSSSCSPQLLMSAGLPAPALRGLNMGQQHVQMQQAVLHGVNGMQGVVVRPVPACAAAAHTAGGAVVVSAPPGPGVSFVAGQRMAAGAGPAMGMQQSIVQAGDMAQRQRRISTPSASQQLLAMAPSVSQAGVARQVAGTAMQGAAAAAPASVTAAGCGQRPPGTFDWKQLASDLASKTAIQAPGLATKASHTAPVTAAGSAGGMLIKPVRAGDAGIEDKCGSWLTVAVPEPSGYSSSTARSDSESARMAAELDELLHQASQQLGWSAIPRATADATDAGLMRSPAAEQTAVALASPPSSSQAAALVASMSKLKPTAAEYLPGKGLLSPAAAAPATKVGHDGSKNQIKSLEALQLPDGFNDASD